MHKIINNSKLLLINFGHFLYRQHTEVDLLNSYTILINIRNYTVFSNNINC